MASNEQLICVSTSSHYREDRPFNTGKSKTYMLLSPALLQEIHDK